MLHVTVEGKPVKMLVDTGATYSSINTALPVSSLSKKTTTLVGFSGQPRTLPFTKPLETVITRTGCRLWHKYIHSTDTPINLMGRDLLSAVQARILCGPEGVIIQFPDGISIQCSQQLQQHGQWLMAPLPAEAETATIYWARLEPETPAGGGVFSTYLLWKPWICSLAPYHPPVDPLHCTLYYDRKSDDVYRDLFEEIEGHMWDLTSSCILIGKEGVAAATELTPEQMQWFKMTEKGVPHISLALAPGHEARELGSMVKHLLLQTDWRKTHIPNLYWSESQKAYQIKQPMVDSGLLEMMLVSRTHGRELTDHEDAEVMLAALPDTLWSQGPFDVGFCHSMAPIDLQMDETQPIKRPQYRWPSEANQGMEDTLCGLWDAGVLEVSCSEWNTPLRPVQKADGKTWRMAHDLRAVNDVTITPVLPVPDPHRILASLNPAYQWFTVIDLANAFFCLPLSPSVRHVFAFTYKGMKLQYTRMPQGFKNSPGLFNQVLKELLEPCQMPDGTLLLQYVDDLLIAAKDEQACLAGTKKVLLWLGEKGFKVSRKKLQCCRQQVTFLGRVLTPSGLAMSPEHRNSILRHPRPATVQEMLSFLGLCGYSRHYIPCFADKTGVLRALIREQGARNLKACLVWTPEATEVFVSLVQELASAATLATPDYTLPFHLDVSISGKVVNGALYQKMQHGRAVLMYCSVPLDNIEQRQPDCSRYAAGLAKVLLKTAHTVMGHPVYVLTDHAVSSFVASAAFTLTPLRQTRLLKILTAPNVNYVHSGVNMADQLLVGPHECASKVQTVTKVRPDLYSTPLGHGRVAFTDGCCWRDRMGSLHAAAAAVEWRDGSFQPLKVMKLNTHPSAQAAEVFALVLALRQCKGEAVTIYSDSAYAVSAALIDLVGWLQNGFTTARGSEIAHKDLMLQLFEALKYPSEVAIVKVPGHSKADTLVARGNRAADELAKQTAGYGGAEDMMVSRGPLIVDGEHPDSCLPLSLSHADLCAAQGATSPEQKSVWLAAKAVKRSDGLWVGPKGQPALPEGRLMSEILTQAHTPSHVGPHAMMIHLRSWWHPKLSDVVWKFVADCESCQTFNARPTLKPKPGLFQPAPWPGAEVIIDFTDMSTRVNGKRFLLVMVDAYSGWPEAYPCSKEDSTAVIKALITHYIPTHGFPALIRSDNGTHFNNKALAKVESILGLKHRFGCVYHPQSQGGVERMNRTLKEKLAKIMAQTTMNWLQALPLALLSVRQSVNRRTGFAPFELMTGRLMPGPATTLVPPEDVTVPNLSHAAYWSYLSALVSSVSAQIGEKSAAAAAEEGVSAEKQLTPYVYVRVISRKWTDPRWKGPFRVLARTSHAAQLDFKGRRWYHYSQLRPAPEFVPSG
ncbi:uncharacterized protein LOC133149058 [Syngnathus typhle]|uniref:uncharacterized protein LOC133149058 n=1 Tax=Syngnathus typhle TaxID=161592 RepID=UPI002A6A03F2|nr:uncharacterized protein LOC133143964 isoform X1 [Syngnathus typhle]XP_061127775.1 uncharacterized protein LOC133149058 [Syngnathus typhle]